MSENIQPGHTVTVEWENLEPITGEVLYTPAGTGDSFTLKVPANTLDGIASRIVYVQNFARMTRNISSPSP